MNLSDKMRLEKLRETFDLNYEVTNLFSRYLTNCPEIITAEAVESLMKDAKIERLDAVAMLLCEIFGLDYSRDPEKHNDRKIILDYIYPAIKFPNPKTYENDPYYQKIAPKETLRDGSWEFKWESYPPYRASIGADMIIKDNFAEIPPLAFFCETFSFPAVLEDGNEWMTLTPIDVDTAIPAINAARGKVITFGLGLGYFAYMASEKEDVESVTVIEKSKSVIRLFEKHILPKFEHKEKIRIINDDAFEYARLKMPKENYTYAFVDTWRDASDGLPMYEKMKELEPLSKNTRFDYWIEIK